MKRSVPMMSSVSKSKEGIEYPFLVSEQQQRQQQQQQQKPPATKSQPTFHRDSISDTSFKRIPVRSESGELKKIHPRKSDGSFCSVVQEAPVACMKDSNNEEHDPIDIMFVDFDQEQNCCETRVELEIQIDSLDEEFNSSLDVCDFQRAVEMQTSLDLMKRRREHLPNVRELRRMANALKRDIKNSIMNKDFGNYENLKTDLESMMLKIEAEEEALEVHHGHITSNNSLKNSSTRAELEAEIENLNEELKEAIDSLDFKKARSVQCLVDGLEARCEFLPTHDELSESIIELKKKLKGAIHERNFNKAESIQKHIKEKERKMNLEKEYEGKKISAIVMAVGKNLLDFGEKLLIAAADHDFERSREIEKCVILEVRKFEENLASDSSERMNNIIAEGESSSESESPPQTQSTIQTNTQDSEEGTDLTNRIRCDVQPTQQSLRLHGAFRVGGNDSQTDETTSVRESNLVQSTIEDSSQEMLSEIPSTRETLTSNEDNLRVNSIQNDNLQQERNDGQLVVSQESERSQQQQMFPLSTTILRSVSRSRSCLNVVQEATMVDATTEEELIERLVHRSIRRINEESSDNLRPDSSMNFKGMRRLFHWRRGRSC